VLDCGSDAAGQKRKRVATSSKKKKVDEDMDVGEETDEDVDYEPPVPKRRSYLESLQLQGCLRHQLLNNRKHLNSKLNLGAVSMTAPLSRPPL